MSNKTTQQINLTFKDTAEGLDKVYKQIKNIASQKDLKLNAEAEKLEHLLGSKIPAYIESLNKKIQAAGGEENLSLLDIQTIKQQFNEIHKMLKNFSNQVGKLQLPPVLLQQVEQTDKALSDLLSNYKREVLKLTQLQQKLSVKEDGSASFADNKYGRQEQKKILQEATGGKSYSIKGEQKTFSSVEEIEAAKATVSENTEEFKMRVFASSKCNTFV